MKDNPGRNAGRSHHLLHRIPDQIFRQTSPDSRSEAALRRQRAFLATAPQFLEQVKRIPAHRDHDGNTDNGRPGSCNPIDYFIEGLKGAVLHGYRDPPFLQLARKVRNSQRGKQFFDRVFTPEVGIDKGNSRKGRRVHWHSPCAKPMSTVPRVIPANHQKDPVQYRTLPSRHPRSVPCPGRWKAAPVG